MEQKHTCVGCNRVFQERGQLTQHIITCNTSKATGNSLSFFNSWKQCQTSSAANVVSEGNTEKLLPLSQTQDASLQNNSDYDRREQSEIEDSNQIIGSLLAASSQDTTITNDVLTVAPSQPRFSQNGDETCIYCKKQFKPRGMKRHEKTCKMKKQQEASRGMENVIPSHEPVSSQDDSVEVQGRTDNVVPNAIWGIHSYNDINMIGSAMYEEVVHWKKNLFKLPSGAAGKRYIRELTRLIDIWNTDSQPLSNIALKMTMVMPAILLQKPSRKSTAKQHGAYLNKRMTQWENGNFNELMIEARSIQKSLSQVPKSKHDTPEHIAKTFAKLMMQGKVHAALRLLDRQESLGVAKMSEEMMNDLRNLHPEAREAADEILMEGEVPFFDPVIFTNIDDRSIATAALKTKGAAGPSGLDADGWRHMLVSRNYGKTGKDLRASIAKMTQQLCTREVQVIDGTNRSNIEAYTANRLIPLEKNPTGVRPIGIGEVLRRIVGKAVISELKPDLIECGGSLQLCTGVKAGCEAASHAMNEIFDEAETDGVLLVDASNAFNALNRAALLHNIQYVCPPLATYIRNCYGTPARLFVGGQEVASAEGTTQGDPTAMDAYAIGIRPLLMMIKPHENGEKMKHVAYADDLAGGSKLELLREWWDRCVQFGPAIGYYPKPSKSWLVVKQNQHERAKTIFEGTGVNITTVGKKYLGGFITCKDPFSVTCTLFRSPHHLRKSNLSIFEVNSHKISIFFILLTVFPTHLAKKISKKSYS